MRGRPQLNISTDYNAKSLPSYFNLLDEDLLGAAKRPDSEADPCLLDTSSESMGSSSIARIEHDLTPMCVSPEVGATQMAVSQHPQQAKVRRTGLSGRCPMRGQSTRRAMSEPKAMGRTWLSMTWPLGTGCPPEHL
jgi:hypothetical protein